MNCTSLYEASKWKKLYQESLELAEMHKIKSLSDTRKVNVRSNYILNSKLTDMLSTYTDETLIDIEGSIPILHHGGILQCLESIEEARLKIELNKAESNRLKWEARFVYCLWKMIDLEEIQARNLK